MMKQYILAILALILTISVTNAQTPESVIERMETMEIDRVYSGEDIRSMGEGDEVEVFGYDGFVHYPFAKVEGKKSVLVLAYEDNYDGDIIYMHAYLYDNRDYELIHSQSYVLSDGNATSSTLYKSTIELDEEGIITIRQKENGTPDVSRFKVGNKYLEFVD